MEGRRLFSLLETWLQCSDPVHFKEPESGEKHLRSETHAPEKWQNKINTCLNKCLDNTTRQKVIDLTPIHLSYNYI